MGIWVGSEELASREQLSEEAALRRVVGGNAQVQRELATLGVLVATRKHPTDAARRGSEPALVKLLQANGRALRNEVLDQVVARNEPLQQAVDAYRNAHASDYDGALRAVVERR